ncbi:hypothetical protein SH668x_003092 [Planctomicrobium sp. SH668]|uniref:hypothetical protein n=1 Tax=Planctomicrobium sp. SH668 TaxID=3448126 RepID=UPI003F5C7900
MVLVYCLGIFGAPVGAGSIRGGCQCASESKANGTCCCINSALAGRQDSGAGGCCAAKLKSPPVKSRASCCAKKSPPESRSKSCCAKKTETVVVSDCHCGRPTDSGFALNLDPRLIVSATSLNGDMQVEFLSVPASLQFVGITREPATPPPRVRSA